MHGFPRPGQSSSADRGTLTWSGKTMHFWFRKWELVSGLKRRLGVWVLGLVLLVVYCAPAVFALGFFHVGADVSTWGCPFLGPLAGG